MAEPMVKIAETIKPDQVTLVPENRAELTTEGGLDCVKFQKRLTTITQRLHKKGILVSTFILPDEKQIAATAEAGCDAVELHTGPYANTKTPRDEQDEFDALAQSAKLGHKLGLTINAGHGLHYHNVQRLKHIPEIVEYNIGHSIISKAVFVGLEQAVREMKQLLQ